ncbi:MAG: SRPBCC domain-containing protein [Pseudonocardiales bacterium]|nr:SRPBCC domain-containing protein [Pseudonocardiales bacterium]
MSELTITRVFDAPRELVFRAWVDPDQLVRWYGPRGVHTPKETIEFDVRPGGGWRLTMVNDETGEQYPTGGVFHEIVEPARLVFTWGDPARADSMTTVTVTFTERGDKTEMFLHQTGLTDLHRRAGVHDGWSSALDKFADLMGAQR